MANHEIPRTARPVERMHGIDADGNVVTCTVYQHTRQGHARPEWYVVEYREANRRIVRSTRYTRQFSGASGRARLDADLAETRGLLAESRVRAGRLVGATL